MVIFRMLLSLTMFLVLGLGVYQAYRYFTGMDPLKMDPKTLASTFLSSEESAKIINTIFSFGLTKNVAGKFGQTPENIQPQPVSDTSSRLPGSGKLLMKFAAVADSHIDNNNLAKALSMAKKEGAKFVIGLGDYSDVGTIEELQKAKDVFDASGLPFYTTAGDHDLWDSRNKKTAATSNFSDVFGAAYQSFSDSGIQFIILANGDNYLGVSALQKQWLEDILKKETTDFIKQTFVFLHEPLYHPSSDHMMGKETPELVNQAQDLAEILKQAGVGEVFAGDIHAFSQYKDSRSGLNMTTVGALTSERNTQKPRFIMVDVFDNGSYNIQDTEI